MANNSLDLTQVKQYQDYVQDFAPDLIKIAMQGFASAEHLSEESGVNGKLTYTVRKSLQRVLKPFTGVYAGDTGQFSHIVRTLSVNVATAEANLVPSDIRGSYLGGAALPDQTLNQAFVNEWVGDFLLRIQTDVDELIWEGDTTGTGIMATFDGFTKQIKTAIAATELDVTVTGALTATNIVESFRAVYRQISAANRKMGGMKLYTSLANKELYAQQYQDKVTKYTDAGKVQTMLFGTNCEIVDVPAWEGNSRILIAPQSTMKYGYNNASNIFTKAEHYHIENSAPVEIGALIVKPWNGEIAVNDQF